MRRFSVIAVLMLSLGVLATGALAQQTKPSADSDNKLDSPSVSVGSVLSAASEQQGATSPADAANLAYLEGKKFYDSKNYTAARKKFVEAAMLDPNNPRWQYNLGLTHRQLGNYQAARQSFLRARELDPAYKKAEIDDKLKAMGFKPDASASAQSASSKSVKQQDSGNRPLVETKPPVVVQPKVEAPARIEAVQPPERKSEGGFMGTLFSLFCCFGLPILIIVAIVMVVRRLMRKPGDQPNQPGQAGVDPQQLADAESKLADVAVKLTRVEHAMRLGEHADLRNLLEHATKNEQAAWTALQKVRNGDRSSFNQLQRTAGEAAAAAQRAVDLASQLYGDRAFAGPGERSGCFFCARPLANQDYMRRVTMKQGDSQEEVVACPDCAAQAERGQSPTIRTGADGRTHWSEMSDYDPYAMRHGDGGQMRQVDAWRYEPQQPMSNLSQLAAGGALLGVGALAGAGTAMAVSHFLDLDAARASGLSHEALRESAWQAGGGRSRRNDYDHS